MTRARSGAALQAMCVVATMAMAMGHINFCQLSKLRHADSRGQYSRSEQVGNNVYLKQCIRIGQVKVEHGLCM